MGTKSENSETGKATQEVEDNNRKEREEREGEVERRRQIWELVGPVF